MTNYPLIFILRDQMDVDIYVENGPPGALADLAGWLADESDFRGRVKLESGQVKSTDLGSAAELLTVILGSGGAGTVLVSSLITWLQTRRTTAKITVESAKGKISFDITTARNIGPLIDKIISTADD